MSDAGQSSRVTTAGGGSLQVTGSSNPSAISRVIVIFLAVLTIAVGVVGVHTLVLVAMPWGPLVVLGEVVVGIILVGSVALALRALRRRNAR